MDKHTATAAPSALLELKVETRPTTKLQPYDNNARVHSRKQIKKIVASIQERGFTNPILVDENDMILCGHGRLEAAKILGLSEVPAIVLAHLSEAAKRAYIIADNQLSAESGWSRGMLRTELQGLIDLGYDVELSGFDTIEIDSILNVGEEDEPSAAGEDPVELPLEAAPVLTQLGDHWVIGKQQFVCGDACQRGSYERLLGDDKAELIFTDPPYNCKISNNVSGLGKVRHGEFVKGSGELTDAQFVMELLRPALRNIERFSQAGAIAFICSDWRAYPRVLEAASGVLHEQKNLIVFAKTNAGMGAFYRSQHELIPVFKVSRGPTINNFGLGEGGRHRSNVWTYAGANTFRRGRMEDLADHPTVKPRKLVADAILDCSRRDGIVLDPFLGSGTLLAAAEISGRRGRGLELDPRYCDVILRRLHKLTKTMPRLADGTPLDEVARERAVEWEGGE